MTPSEWRLWQELRANRLGGLQFRRQQIIDGFIADFYCHAAGLIVEVDGAVHKDSVDYDAMRDRLISARGLLVLRFSNDCIEQDMNSVLSKILTAANERLSACRQEN